MKYLSNSNGWIPALKKWQFTIDVGTPIFYVLYPPLIFFIFHCCQYISSTTLISINPYYLCRNRLIKKMLILSW